MIDSTICVGTYLPSLHPSLIESRLITVMPPPRGILYYRAKYSENRDIVNGGACNLTENHIVITSLPLPSPTSTVSIFLSILVPTIITRPDS
jgi:hypothetical protein